MDFGGTEFKYAHLKQHTPDILVKSSQITNNIKRMDIEGVIVIMIGRYSLGLAMPPII